MLNLDFNFKNKFRSLIFLFDDPPLNFFYETFFFITREIILNKSKITPRVKTTENKM